MALQSSGPITLNNVNVELGLAGTATISLNDAAVRTLFAIPSGAISMSNGYGKSNIPPPRYYLLKYGSVTDYDIGSLSYNIVDSSKNIYQVYGFYYPSASSPQGGAYHVIKYNTAGTMQWVKQGRQLGVNNTSRAQSENIVIDSAGNIIFIGTYYDLRNTSGSYNECNIVKLNSSGTMLWQKSIGANNRDDEKARTIAVDSDNNVYGLMYNSTVSSYSEDLTLFKLDSSGNQLWKKTILGPGFTYDWAGGMAIDSANNVIITFSSSWTTRYIVKLNSSGSVVWQKLLGSGSGSPSHRLEVVCDPSNNIYVCGQTINQRGGFVYKLNSSGITQWKRGFDQGGDPGPAGSSLSPAFTDIALDSSGNVYVVGERYLFLNQSPFLPLRTSMLVKYNSSGTLLFQREFIHSSQAPGNTKVRLDSININASGDMVISGYHNFGDSSGKAITFVLPPDGSLTGTYDNIIYRSTSRSEYTVSDPDTTDTSALTYDQYTGYTVLSNNTAIVWTDPGQTRTYTEIGV